MTRRPARFCGRTAKISVLTWTRPSEGGSSGWRRQSCQTSAGTSSCRPFNARVDGRSLLHVGKELPAGSTEAHWRFSMGRAYCALLYEVLGALGRSDFALPPRDKIHTFAGVKFVSATDPNLKRISLTLEALGRLRNAADYQFGTSGPFVRLRFAATAVADAESAVALLDAHGADPARRAGAVRTIPLWSRLTTASASNKVSVVKPSNWPRAFDPDRGFERQNESTRSRFGVLAAWSMPRREWFRAFGVS
jgi:hypothetical protein